MKYQAQIERLQAEAQNLYSEAQANKRMATERFAESDSAYKKGLRHDEIAARQLRERDEFLAAVAQLKAAQ